MKLLRAIYINYKRLGLTGITKIDWKIGDDLQFVLGSNGCGKSELTRHSAPITITKGEFGPHGGKELHYLHDGKLIIFKAKVGKKETDIKHYFSVDGEELQAPGGGVASVQKELVKRFLGFDEYLHAVLSGRLGFCNMTPQKRGEFLTRISSTDLTYATKLYKNICERHRDALGAKKRLAEAITTDTNRLLSLEATKEMVAQSHVLQSNLNDFLGLIEQGVPNEAINYDRNINEKCRTLSASITAAIKRYKTAVRNCGFDSAEALVTAIGTKQAAINTNLSLVTSYTEQLLDTQRTVADMELNQSTSSDEIYNQLSILQEGLSRQPTPDCREYPVSIEEIQNCWNMLVELSMEFGVLEEPVIKSVDEYEATKARIHDTNININSIKLRLQRASLRVEAFRSAHEATCPKCSTVFKPGFEKCDDHSIAEWTAKEEAVLAKQTADVEKMLEEINEWDTYQGRLTQIIKIRRMHPNLEFLWVNIFDNNTCAMSLSNIIAAFPDLKKNVEIWDTYHTRRALTKAKIQETEQLYDAVLKAEKLGGLEKFSKQAAELEIKITSLNQMLNKDNEDLREWKILSNIVAQADSALSEVSGASFLLSQQIEMYGKAVWNEQINIKVNELQIQLASIAHAVSERETIEVKLKQLNELHTETEREEVEWKALGDALSPKSGLIASQMTKHINHVVGQMNSVIAEVWDYDLEVIPCGIESDDLNYVFPMYVGDNETPAADIKQGSTGQQDIINFAFSIVVMLQQGYSEYPLWLDEVGASFDGKHRAKFMEYIAFLISNHKVSQVFMINHYSEMYGSLGEYETLVLDPTNIIVPPNANENVLIERA